MQIEHALAAVAGGTTSLGIKGELVYAGPIQLSSDHHRFSTAASNGIVIATEKKTSSILIDDSMIEKVAVICPNIGTYALPLLELHACILSLIGICRPSQALSTPVWVLTLGC